MHEAGLCGAEGLAVNLHRWGRLAEAEWALGAPLTLMFDDAAVARAPERPAVFLDKDGTLIVDVPYNADPARIVFTPGAPQALRRLAGAGFLLVVVTNQAGLASGRLSRHDYAAMRRALEARVQAEAGVALDGWYTCPHSPGPDGLPRCLCRKPAAGLLRQARSVHGIDLARSWMVGDILDDVEAGRRAGCRTVLLDVGNETVWRRSPLREPDHRCTTLAEAAEHIVAQHEAGAASAALPAPVPR